MIACVGETQDRMFGGSSVNDRRYSFLSNGTSYPAATLWFPPFLEKRSVR